LSGGHASSPHGTDRLSLGLSLRALLLVGVALAALLGGLERVDRARARHQLRQAAEELCALPTPPRALAELDRRIDLPDEKRDRYRAERRFSVASGSTSVFVQESGETCVLEWDSLSCGGLEPRIPAAFGDWNTEWPQGTCRTARHGASLLAARRLRSPAGRPVLLQVSVRRGADWLDLD
jgi:hypothetical protein